MPSSSEKTRSSLRHPRLLSKADFQLLLDFLSAQGYRIIGPTVSQGAIVYEQVRRVEDLPRGWTDEQSAGKYRVKRRDDDAWFGYNVGPHSWKQFLFPPTVTVATADREQGAWKFQNAIHDDTAFAFLGVRACELAAIAVQDRTFIHDQYVDPIYRNRREKAFFIAVNCTQAASTCFCTSMHTGPECTKGYDLALTELIDAFTIESGSDKGENILSQLPTRPATDAELFSAAAARQQAVEQITKHLDTTNIRDLLLGNLEHPRWTEVANRCLSCTNCTMVCPTCFCSSVNEVSDLSGDHAERVRQWDSCFNVDFSYMNGAIVRNNIRSRYRQWLTHKLASWIDQFGVSGCVGCGRCITWCPVEIDLTEEVTAIRGEKK